MTTWHKFDDLPDENISIRIIDGNNYVHPYVMRMHQGKLEARYDEMSPWDYVGIHCMNSIFNGYKWCYESDFEPAPSTPTLLEEMTLCLSPRKDLGINVKVSGAYSDKLEITILKDGTQSGYYILDLPQKD